VTNSSGLLMHPSLCMAMVRGEFGSRKRCFHKLTECRLGQNSRFRNDATCSLRDHESCLCRDSAVCVKTLLKVLLLIGHIGRDKDYQTLNMNYAVNVFKFATIIKMFPESVKPYVAMSCHDYVSSSLIQDRCTHAIQPSITSPAGNGVH